MGQEWCAAQPPPEPPVPHNQGDMKAMVLRARDDVVQAQPVTKASRLASLSQGDSLQATTARTCKHFIHSTVVALDSLAEEVQEAKKHE
mmetsp:Transcript_23183/g.51089  ORF Transcript_23183/g.51089 Transcript_23183/m.51089 type:complete len:89 (+) Transcript_23183:28-294(+)|eukprot:CAMPEP_0204325674 /NCGR_PEP_ID=MMETSP0469-20131031/11210_1 /ASSEMBLY_ACC=CAM_ASM_000384 /TAXON_ID=2969 /ORGANISM="Oxyrrhis marina" /LENGTH=88 /DNA_ID=CAMNT_0051307573 /DNA_START=15 /DNA_END=281 /DNA_ORIENTATION=+